MIIIFKHDKKRNTKPVKNFENLVDNFFNEDMFFVPAFMQSTRIDVKETADEYLVEVELPGINKENIDLTFNEGVLRISAHKEENIDEERENFVRKERKSGKIERNLTFNNVDENNIKANFKEGILYITLPKVEERGSKINIFDE